jgi:hypothetical protein
MPPWATVRLPSLMKARRAGAINGDSPRAPRQLAIRWNQRNPAVTTISNPPARRISIKLGSAPRCPRWRTLACKPSVPVTTPCSIWSIVPITTPKTEQRGRSILPSPRAMKDLPPRRRPASRPAAAPDCDIAVGPAFAAASARPGPRAVLPLVPVLPQLPGAWGPAVTRNRARS